MYEHMVRVPLMIRIPKGLGGQTKDSQALTTGADIAPTILDIAGCTVPECDGKSLKLEVLGRSALQREFAVSQYYSKQKWVNPIRTIRSQNWKYNLYQGFGDELYDLRNDPEELENLAQDSGYADMKASLADEFEQWIQTNTDPFFTLHPTDRQGHPLNQETGE